MKSKWWYVVMFVIGFGIHEAGYYQGKRAADRYYAEHPVTLIQPLKLRAPEPAASVEEPR